MFMSYKIKITNGCGTVFISLVQVNIYKICAMKKRHVCLDQGVKCKFSSFLQFRIATNKQLQSGFDHIPTKCSIKCKFSSFLQFRHSCEVDRVMMEDVNIFFLDVCFVPCKDPDI